jgi:alkanesulfonate monooxygenase SsuD/methylene tetrahydromethanopterin reductase-like flavin-dependent oxidoreductase (luciferase family)
VAPAVGVDVHDVILEPDAAGLLARAADAGLDHLTVGDHVSFHDGTGFDGLVSATAALTTQQRLPVHLGVYQLALRHPVPVARQLATISQLAPGRLVLGVGVGGEDRSEVLNCGVDPATRGRRLDEGLRVLRALAGGGPVDHDGEFFRLAAATIRPALDPPVPVVVGGRADAAIRRAAELADGWVGIFVSARRFTDTVARVIEHAETVRRRPTWFGLNVWCGLDDSPAVARELLATRLSELYRLPFERFERVCPAGTPEQVAEWLAPFVAAGCAHITLIPAASGWAAGIDAAAKVRAHLHAIT